MNPVSTREKNKAGGQKQVTDQIAGGPRQNSIPLLLDLEFDIDCALLKPVHVTVILTSGAPVIP
jgi:hypothetical protein